MGEDVGAAVYDVLPTFVLIPGLDDTEAEVTERPRHAATSQDSRRMVMAGRGGSITAREENGEASPTRDEAAMMAETITSCHRWGRNSPADTPTANTSRACAFRGFNGARAAARRGSIRFVWGAARFGLSGCELINEVTSI